MNMREYLGGLKSINPDNKVYETTNMPKGARSITNPSEVPKGWNVVKGPRGGVYAVPPANEQEEDPKNRTLRDASKEPSTIPKHSPNDPKYRTLRDATR